MIEQNDEWLVGRRYLSRHSLDAAPRPSDEEQQDERRPTSSPRPEQPTINPTSYTTSWDLTKTPANSCDAYALGSRRSHGGLVKRLAYTRRQAAEALGISVATLDRRVVPVIETVKTEWGTRLIPVDELQRYLDERRQQARPAGRHREPPGRESDSIPSDRPHPPRLLGGSNAHRDRPSPQRRRRQNFTRRPPMVAVDGTRRSRPT